MNTGRKIIAVLIIIFLALPILFGIIWAVGLTRAVVSSEFLTELPKKVIAKVPDMADEVLEAAAREGTEINPNTRAWLQAAVKVEMKPHELLARTGLLQWLENELTGSLATVGEMLRGQRPYAHVTLNMKPLKAALGHEVFGQYFTAVLKNLPQCGDWQQSAWEQAAVNGSWHERLPACQPQIGLVDQAWQVARLRMEGDIPDEVDLMQGVEHFPRRWNVAQSIVTISYLLFLIPAVFIAIAAWVAAPNLSGFLRWSGVTTMIGGLLGLGLAFPLSRFFNWGIEQAHFHYWGPYSQFKEVLLDHTGEIMSVVSRQLFSPVVSVAEAVCIVGLIIFALSFAVTTTPKRKVQPPVQASAT